MLGRRLLSVAAFCLALGPAGLPLSALAQDPGGAQFKSIGVASQTGPVPSLFVLNSDGATLKDGKLVLTGVSPNAIVFADRPTRLAGHVETQQFIETWNQGEDNFGIDPPNATISLLDGAKVADAVVTISDPQLEGDKLTFNAVVLEGSLDGAAGFAALFIDDRGGGGGGGGGGRGFAGGGGADHFSNYSHVQDPHAAYYQSNDTVNRNVNVTNNYNRPGYGWNDGWPVGAGAVGLAAGAALGAATDDWGGYGGAYNAPCGYPPYPPCY